MFADEVSIEIGQFGCEKRDLLTFVGLFFPAFFFLHEALDHFALPIEVFFELLSFLFGGFKAFLAKPEFFFQSVAIIFVGLDGIEELLDLFGMIDGWGIVVWFST